MFSEGCLQLWIDYINFFFVVKRWVTRKRTTRFPVAYSYRKDDNDNHGSPNKSGQKRVLDDDVEQAAALVLTKAYQRGGLPHVSQSPVKKNLTSSSPSQSRVSMLVISIFWFVSVTCFVMSDY